MNVKRDFSIKHLEEAEVGELVQMETFGHLALAVILKKLQDDQVLYGFLNAPGSGEEAPFFLKFEPEGRCLSFGTDWELELARTPETAFGPDALDAAGMILVSEPDVMMKFGRPPRQIQKGPLYFNFTAMDVSSPPTRGIRILSWKIWRLKESPRPQSVQPLFEFTAKLT